MFALQTMIFPAASPEIMPPSVLKHRAPTDLLCSLKTLFAKLPFHCTNKPLVIDVTIDSPSVAIAKLGLRGAFPNTPFLVSNLPPWKRQKTTYFSQAQTTSSSCSLNLIAKITDFGPCPNETKAFLAIS